MAAVRQPPQPTLSHLASVAVCPDDLAPHDAVLGALLLGVCLVDVGHPLAHVPVWWGQGRGRGDARALCQDPQGRGRGFLECTQHLLHTGQHAARRRAAQLHDTLWPWAPAHPLWPRMLCSTTRCHAHQGTRHRCPAPRHPHPAHGCSLFPPPAARSPVSFLLTTPSILISTVWFSCVDLPRLKPCGEARQSGRGWGFG